MGLCQKKKGHSKETYNQGPQFQFPKPPRIYIDNFKDMSYQIMFLVLIVAPFTGKIN
jgi:hypothetical protein